MKKEDQLSFVLNLISVSNEGLFWYFCKERRNFELIVSIFIAKWLFFNIFKTFLLLELMKIFIQKDFNL